MSSDKRPIEALTTTELDAIRNEPDAVVISKSKPRSFDFLHGRGHVYEIECSRCTTQDELIDWILHMSAKRWVTTRHIRQFIDLWRFLHGS